MMPPMGPPGPPPPPAPPPAAPPPPGPQPPMPLSADDLQFWRTAVERATKLNADMMAAWDAKGNLTRYTPKSVMTDQQALDLRINVAKDFADVERKKAALFYDTPTIALVPDEGTPSPPLLLHQELINQTLGPKRMHCKQMVLPTIQDCLVVIQPVPTEIGYTAVTEMIDQQTPALDPATGQPAIDPQTGQPQMQVQKVPVTVWEDIFWTRISPKAMLLPNEWRSTAYDDAPWLGYRWRRPVTQVKREYGIAEEASLADNAGDDLPYFQPLTESPDEGEPHCTGVKLWYRAHVRDMAVTHPEVIRELVLIDGYDMPAVHRPCPYQTIGPDGKLTPDSMIGYPLHPLALRNLTDAAYVAADCTLTGPLTRELNKFRTQIVQRRDGSKLHMFIDSSRVTAEVRDKIGQGTEPTMIPVEAGALDAGADKVMAQVPAIKLGRESYEGQAIIERDRAQVLGIDANQVGAQGDNAKTATEVSTVQRNADARFEQERQRVLEWWLTGVQKVTALLLRYGNTMAGDVLGPQRGQMWAQAKQQGILNRYSFEIVIDSGNYVDIEARKRQDMQLYNMTAQDPATHHEELLMRLAEDFGLDPVRWIVTQRPEKQPPPPSLAISVKPEDLDPALPSYVGTFAILSAAGVKGLPPPLSLGQPPPPGAPPMEHQGMADRQPMLDKHQMDESGARTGPPV